MKPLREEPTWRTWIAFVVCAAVMYALVIGAAFMLMGVTR